jgi:hypothetical protein
MRATRCHPRQNAQWLAGNSTQVLQDRRQSKEQTARCYCHDGDRDQQDDERFDLSPSGLLDNGFQSVPNGSGS